MPANTAHGYPYPLGTDPVADGDDAIKNLADKIEARLKGGMYATSLSFPNVPVGSNQSGIVTWPASYFTATPIVAATVVANQPSIAHVGYSTGSATSATFFAHNGYTGVLSITAQILAYQVT